MNTFGLCPKKSTRKSARRRTLVELRDSAVATWRPAKAIRCTQDAEGTLAVRLADHPRLGIYDCTMYYPRALWRLA